MAPISVGELIDKITILELKIKYITSEAKKANVVREYGELCALLEALNLPDIRDLRQQLYTVNDELWHIENYKRACEQLGNFDLLFIEAARNVYLKNDLRAKIKRDINDLTGSSIVEEKSH